MNSWELREDPWLAQHLGTACYALQSAAPGKGTVTLEATLNLPHARTAMLYVRVPVTACTQVALLATHGFMLVDTGVTLERQGLSASRPEAWKRIRPARPEDETAVCALAASAFTWTRFHQDSAIGACAGNAIQSAWVANFFQGRRGSHLFVAEEQGNIQGFHLVLTPDASTMAVDLIAVHPQAQGQGLGGALVNVAQHVTQRARACVGTQLANVSALRAYQHMGFHVSHATYTLHRHPTRS